MDVIIGIDPGSRCTGYGFIQVDGSNITYLAHGQISARHELLHERLLHIDNQLREIIQLYTPNDAAIEDVFFHRNAASALQLGQARGVALLNLARAALPITSYSPREIKQAITGYGAADKSQMQNMIKALLKLPSLPATDAADALAIALCHAHTRDMKRKLQSMTKKATEIPV